MVDALDRRQDFTANDLLALTWDCVDLNNNVVYVKKTLQSIKGQGLVIAEPNSGNRRSSSSGEAMARTVAWPVISRFRSYPSLSCIRP